jgi:diacylglycerol kinase (ATP)
MNMDNVFVIISNSKYTGGDYLIAPRAKIDDGKLDLIILNKLSRINLLKTFPKIFDGSHVDTQFVDYIQAKTIKLETNVPKILSPDGEVCGEFPAEVSCISGAIDLFA